MTPERLEEGLHWAWQQSYSWRSMASRIFGSRCMIPLSVSLNLGYRFFAKNLPKKARLERQTQIDAEQQPSGPQLDSHAISDCSALPETQPLHLPIIQPTPVDSQRESCS